MAGFGQGECVGRSLGDKPLALNDFTVIRALFLNYTNLTLLLKRKLQCFYVYVNIII